MYLLSDVTERSNSITELHQHHNAIELLERCPEQLPGNPLAASLPVLANVAELEDVPPNGGYGWVCTACVFLINAHTWGINASWAIFMDRFLTTEAFPGATKFEYALIGGLSICQALILSPIVAAAQKHWGVRTTMLFGSVVIFAALFSASAATQIWHLFLSQGFCFGWGMGFVYLPAMTLLPPWFSSHRSLAVGFATSGAGLGGLAYSLVTGRLMELSGTVWTYRILSFCALTMNALCALLLRERPSHSSPTSRRSFNPADFIRVEILLVVCWGFVTELGYIALLYSLPNYATSIGLSPTQGSVVQALLNLGLGVGRPVIGYYSDRIGRINMALGMTLLCGILCFSLWIPARTYGVLLVFATLAGMVCGTFWSTVSPVLAEVVGIAEFGSTFGSIMFALVLPTTFAEGIAMQLVKGSGLDQFLISQIFVGSMFVAGAIFVWMLRSWQIHKIEKKAADEQVLALTETARSTAIQVSGIWLTPKRMFIARRV